VTVDPSRPAAREGDRALAHLDRAEAVELLSGAAYGRLVFTLRALPEVLPVNCRVFGDAVVIRVGTRSRAVDGALDTVVAFQCDHIDVDDRTGWSVTVVGRTAEILDPAERDRILDLPLVAWAGGDRDRLIRIPLDRVTGRRLVPVDARS
jgi:nitroimidazol reductase NimA-like FMN-containing flavoprotein (pyridoxamine 5'-phosphate oxidase superfamily)